MFLTVGTQSASPSATKESRSLICCSERTLFPSRLVWPYRISGDTCSSDRPKGIDLDGLAKETRESRPDDLTGHKLVCAQIDVEVCDAEISQAIEERAAAPAGSEEDETTLRGSRLIYYTRIQT